MQFRTACGIAATAGCFSWPPPNRPRTSQPSAPPCTRCWSQQPSVAASQPVSPTKNLLQRSLLPNKPLHKSPKPKQRQNPATRTRFRSSPPQRCPWAVFRTPPAKVLPQSPPTAQRVAAAQAGAAAYRSIYRSIPYNRQLSLINPGYRHDATMELLTAGARRADSRSESPRPASSASSRSTSTPDP